MMMGFKRCVDRGLARSLVAEGVEAWPAQGSSAGQAIRSAPRVSVSTTKIQELRAEGLTLSDIAARYRISKTTVIRTSK